MLYSIFIVSDTINNCRQAVFGKEDPPAFFVLLAAPSEKNKLAEAYRFFSNNHMINFSIALNASAALPEACLEDICAFLFLPGYCQINQQQLMAIVTDDTGIFNAWSQQLTAKLQQQGIADFRLIQLTAGELPHQQSPQTTADVCPVFKEADALVQSYKIALAAGVDSDDFFFLRGAEHNVDKVIAGLQLAELAMATKNPNEYALACRQKKLVAANAAIRQQYRHVCAELDNYKIHMETIRSAHEATQLQEYYNKEYEILPLWYKRFGHIIKVLTGKRSFASLFGKNYKNNRP